MKLAAFAALVMLVASCCPCRKHRKGDSKPFVSTEWQLVQLNGRAVPVEGDLFTVVFGEDGRLSGLGACNRLMGSYETTETGGLTVGQMASTRMFCPGLDQEQAFSDVLSGATHYEVDGDMLMLLTDGELRLFCRPDSRIMRILRRRNLSGLLRLYLWKLHFLFCSQPCRPDRFVSDFSVL